MYNALRDLLIRLIAEMIAWVTDTTSWLVETSLSVENARWISDNPLTLELISDSYMYIYGAVVTLVALKFLAPYAAWRLPCAYCISRISYRLQCRRVSDRRHWQRYRADH